MARVVSTRHRAGRYLKAVAVSQVVLAGLPLGVRAADSAPASATQARQYQLDLPAGPLARSIAGLSIATGQQLLYTNDRVFEQRNAQALRGRYTLEQALDLLLAGTGLSWQRSGPDVLTITNAPATGSLELGATTIGAQRSGALTEDTGSYTTAAVTIGKMPLSIKETPQTVSVISRQRMEDQKLTTLSETLAQTTGITEVQGSLTNSYYLSRGFKLTNFRVDGGPSIGSSVWKDTDTAIYDHVEVLRGADGLFAGAGEPAGTVNLVRKRPTAQSQVSMTTSVSRWDGYRAELDASGPLAFDGRLRGRAVIVEQDRHSFVEGVESDRGLFYGVLEGDLTDSTTLFGGVTQERSRSNDQIYGLPRYSTGEDLRLARSTHLSGEDDYKHRTTRSYFLRVDQALGENWKLAVDTAYTRFNIARSYYNFNGAISPLDGSGSAAEYGYSMDDSHEKSVDVNLKGTFELFGLNHDVIAGWMWDQSLSRNPLYSAGTVSVPDIFTFDPADYPSGKDLAVENETLRTRVRTDGFYASLRMQLAEPLHWIVGSSITNYRYDYSDDVYGDQVYPVTYTDKHVLVPFTGLTYDLTPEWTAYGSISEIYLSQADLLKGPQPGTSLDPITGRNHELGIKGEFLDARLNAYAALYYTRRDGQGIRDPNYDSFDNPSSGASCCYVGDGRIVSKGLDLEVSGQVLDRLEATLGYTYNSNANKVSSVMYSSRTPRHLLKLFATYQLPGALSSLKIGGGMTAQSATYNTGSVRLRDGNGNLTSTMANYDITQAGYTLWNLFARYEIDRHWSTSLNVSNLFDKHYYSTIGYSNYGNFYGEPRSYTLALTGKF